MSGFDCFTIVVGILGLILCMSQDRLMVFFGCVLLIVFLLCGLSYLIAAIHAFSGYRS